MSESICFLLNKVLFFPLLPGFFLGPYQIIPLPFHNHPWEPAQPTNTPPTFLQNSRTGKLWRISVEEPSPAQPSHQLASDNRSRKEAVGGSFWKRWLAKWWLVPLSHALFIFILTPTTQNPHPKPQWVSELRPKHILEAWAGFQGWLC